MLSEHIPNMPHKTLNFFSTVISAWSVSRSYWFYWLLWNYSQLLVDRCERASCLSLRARFVQAWRAATAKGRIAKSGTSEDPASCGGTRCSYNRCSDLFGRQISPVSSRSLIAIRFIKHGRIPKPRTARQACRCAAAEGAELGIACQAPGKIHPYHLQIALRPVEWRLNIP